MTEKRKVLGKLNYYDALYIYIQMQEKYVAKTKEVENGVSIDFDKASKLIGIEILDVMKRFSLS